MPMYMNSRDILYEQESTKYRDKGAGRHEGRDAVQTGLEKRKISMRVTN